MDSNPGVSLFKDAINIQNSLQNLEEAEELEEQARRQEEIKHLLTTALDDFHYDDSTVNSSGNMSGDEESNLVQKYNNAGMEDQLKILYEVRVRENIELKEQLSKLKVELAKVQDKNNKELLLMEAEKNKIEISLKESQGLLVSKNKAIVDLEKNLNYVNELVEKQQDELQKLRDEKIMLKQSNRDILEQLDIMKKGQLMNTVNDNDVYEKHQAELSKMQVSLEAALKKLDCREHECKTLEDRLKDSLRERDGIIIEKSASINSLTQHLEAAQNQVCELIQVVEKLSEENKKLKKNSNPDLHKILSNMKNNDDLVKAMEKKLEESNKLFNNQSSEFEALQSSYNDLNKSHNICQQLIGSYEKQIASFLGEKRYFEIQTVELEKQFKVINTAREDLQKEKLQLEQQVSDLTKQVEYFETEINIMKANNKSSHEDGSNSDRRNVAQNMNSQGDVCKPWNINNSCGNIEFSKENTNIASNGLCTASSGLYTPSGDSAEDEVLGSTDNVNVESKKVINRVSRSPSRRLSVKSSQVCQLEAQLETAYKNISLLQDDLLQCKRNIEILSQKAVLDEEKDSIIKSLQEKALQFEQILREKENKPSLIDVSVITDPIDVKPMNDNENEADRNVDLKREFEGWFQEMKNNIKSEYSILRKNEDCSNCNKFKSELDQLEIVVQNQAKQVDVLKFEKQNDREKVVEILEYWQKRFLEIEVAKEALMEENQKYEQYCQELVARIGQVKHSEFQLQEILKQENAKKKKSTNDLKKQWHQHTQKILNVLNKFQESESSCMDTIREIEKKYSSKKLDLNNATKQSNRDYCT